MNAFGSCRTMVVSLLGIVVATAPLLPAQQPAKIAKVESKAVVLESPDFLKPPANLAVKGFTIAKTAPTAEVAFFAGLEERGKGTLWSSWGDGCVARNGKYYTSIGDHLGTDATSYVYEYDPANSVLRRVVDVLMAIGQMLGLFGHGKIHAGLHEAADGTLYFTTYWGKPKEVDAAFDKGYSGSLLLRYDPKTERTQKLGAIVPKQGLPGSYHDCQRDLLYFYAVYQGDVVAYDIKANKVKFQGGADVTAGQRTFLGGSDGRVYFSDKDGTLRYYDPKTNQLAATKARLPAGANGKKDNTLRAAARPTRAGLLHGMTTAGQLFSFDPGTETVKDLGPNFAGGEYTAVMVLSPDEKYLYFAPGAHGSAFKAGVPVVQYEIATGQRKVLAFLKEPLLQKFRYQLGGTYNLQIDPKGERLFFTFNGAPVNANASRIETFGQPVVVVLGIPKGER